MSHTVVTTTANVRHVTPTNTKGWSVFLSKVTAVMVLMMMTMMIMYGTTSATATVATTTQNVRRTSDNRHNRTSLLSLAPNDPYRWKEQLMMKQKDQQDGRHLEVEVRTILVIRIVTDGDSNRNSDETKIKNVLFDEATQITVQRQMQLCSGGRIVLQPSNDGIITLRMNYLGGQVEAYTTAATEQAMKEHFRSSNTLTGYKEQLRKMADHVLIILPSSFPANTFVANAEIGRSICVFSYQWMASISAYMHEMGHNMYLRHSGRGSSEPYGDNTGYMGVSSSQAYAPQKCYNAAQHWTLNFYESQRLSLLNYDLSSAPVLLQLAAFVDHDKTGSDYTVLVQASSNIYLQFNRAKSYNVGTDMMQDQVVVVNDAGDKTVLIAGLDAASSALSVSSIVIQVCSINIGAESGIDYAVVAVANSNNNRMCDGAAVSSASSARPPTNAPIAPVANPTNVPITPVANPTNAPITPSPTIAPIVITPAPVPISVPAPLPTRTPTDAPTDEPTWSPSTWVPTKTSPPSTFLPTEEYISSPNPTGPEEKRGDDEDPPFLSDKPIFVSVSSENDNNEGEIVRSSSNASSNRSSAFLPGIVVLVGVVIIVSALVTIRRMAIHRYYRSKPLRTRDDDNDKDEDDKSGSTNTFIVEDIEVSTNGFVSNLSNFIRDFEIDLGGNDNNFATKKHGRSKQTP